MGRNPVGYSPSLSDFGRAVDVFKSWFKKKKPYSIDVKIETRTIDAQMWKIPTEPQSRLVTRILNEPPFKKYAARHPYARITFEDGYNTIFDMDLLRRVKEKNMYKDFEADTLNSYREAFKRILNGGPYNVKFERE